MEQRFGEVGDYPQGPIDRTGMVIPAHHITYILSERDCVPVRLYSTPVAVLSPSLANVTTATESGECLVDASSHVNAPEALALERRRLLAGQHGVVAVPITIEHRVVVAQPHSAGVYA